MPIAWRAKALENGRSSRSAGAPMTESYYEVDAPAQARVGSLACVTLLILPPASVIEIDLMTELTQISLTVPQA